MSKYKKKNKINIEKIIKNLKNNRTNSMSSE